MPGEPTTRCFIACWPGPGIARRLEELSGSIQNSAGGRKIPRKNIHITLAFLGNLVSAQRAAAGACCPALPESFTLTLDRIGFFKHGGIVWAGARTPDPEFVHFVEQLRYSLRRVGFRIDARPFTPHLTLLRRARKRPRVKLDAMEWTIGDYTLATSELTPEGSQYSIVKRWSTPGDVK